MTSLTSARESGNNGQWHQVGVDEFVAVGSDDLAKYRIAQLVCTWPGVCWDAAEVADRLGLRPIQRTIAELDELAQRRILERQSDDGNVRYRLTTDQSLRRDLIRLLNLAQEPFGQKHILTRLASRSLQRIKTVARRGPRRLQKKWCLQQ